MCKCDTTARAFNELARVAYVTKYPGYCRACNGAGVLVDSYDPSPAGVGLASGVMYAADPCEKCLTKNRCPRCGATSYAVSWERATWRPRYYTGDMSESEDVLVDWSEPFACHSCGWCEDEGHGQATDGMPPEWECYCYEEDADRAYEEWRKENVIDDWLVQAEKDGEE